MEQNADLLITGRYLLPTYSQQDLIENGAVAVAGDSILEIGEAYELKKKYADCDRIEEKHGLIMPGLINTHTHAPMSLFRGLADDLPLMTWLQDHIFPIEAKLTADMVYQATLLSCAEMIKSGTTSFCDMYLFAKEVAKATDESGMRGWIGEVLYDFPSPSYGELENGFRYVDEMFENYRNHPLINITVDPHAVYTCSPDLLKRTGKMAADNDALWVIHLSENDMEVKGCLEQYSRTPVNHLEHLGLLGDHVLAAHCVKLNDREIDLLAQRCVSVAHCQESNMKLASGTSPVPALLERGVTLSIGTDGPASNNDVDLFSEMSSVAKIHKGVLLDPTVMSAEQTLRAATLGGAEALQADDRVGSLKPGNKADLIVLDLNQPHLTPIYNVVSHLVYAASGADVIHSVINGQIVMKNKTLLTLDEGKILATITEIAQRISHADSK